METRTYQVYTFSELSPEAQEKAIQHWQESADDFDWSADTIIEDAAGIALLFGLDIYQTRKPTMDGKHIYKPTVYYSGFWSQGDGACFEGTYQYKKGALKAVKDHAPQDKELHQIVESLQELQRRSFYRLTASCKQRGHYYHSGCMSVDVDNSEGFAIPESIEDDLKQSLRNFADWIYSRLEEEYDYITSDEYIRGRLQEYDNRYTEDGELD